MKRAFIISLLLIDFACSAQERTISKTTGKLFAMPGWDKSMEATTMGIDWSVAYPVEQKGRNDYEMGWKCNVAHIPEGIAGDRLGVSGFFTSPITDDLVFQLGTGFGAYTRPWQFTHDPENKYISTCLNCVIDIGFAYSVTLSDKNEMVLGAKFLHNSNGWIAKPNMGLNYVQVEVGYRARNRKTRVLHFDERYDSNSHFLVFSGGFCVPETGLATNRDVRQAYCIQGGYMRSFRNRRGVGISLDLGYNFADNFVYRAKGKPVPFPLNVGLCALYEAYFGPFSTRVGMGYYLYDAVDYGRIYERVGVYYRLDNGDKIGLSVKARIGRADFIEWGYIFNV